MERLGRDASLKDCAQAVAEVNKRLQATFQELAAVQDRETDKIAEGIRALHLENKRLAAENKQLRKENDDLRRRLLEHEQHQQQQAQRLRQHLQEHEQPA